MVSRETLTRRFADALHEANKRTNLVSRKLTRPDVRAIVASFSDTLEVARVGAVEGLLDIGSGAGLPGIPLAIRYPRTHVVLAESRKLRIEWLRTIVLELGLENTSILPGRVERYSELEAAFPVVTAFGVGPPAEMIPLAARYLTPGGVAVHSAPAEPTRQDESSWLLAAAIHDSRVEHVPNALHGGRALLLVRTQP